jgi:hypothetical protein
MSTSMRNFGAVAMQVPPLLRGEAFIFVGLD